MNHYSAFNLLTELFTDLRHIQIQLLNWLPTYSLRVNHPGFRHLVAKHIQDSSIHLRHIDDFFSRNQTDPVEGVSRAIKLIIDDSDANVPKAEDSDRSDLLLLLQFLRVEQFEITSYEIVARVADQVGYSDEAEMLVEFLAARDASASILRDLQSELIRNTFPLEIEPLPLFPE